MTAAVRGRVAVIAVHGVADQKPGESAAALGAMLLSIGRLETDAPHVKRDAPPMHKAME